MKYEHIFVYIKNLVLKARNKESIKEHKDA